MVNNNLGIKYGGLFKEIIRITKNQKIKNYFTTFEI